VTHWAEFSAADFDRSRARKGTRQRSADPGLFHVATPVERPATTKPDTKRLADDVALFEITEEGTDQQ
jgi:hypothetical protein